MDFKKRSKKYSEFDWQTCGRKYFVVYKEGKQTIETGNWEFICW